MNPVDPPAHTWMPENSFQDSTRRRRRHDIISDTFCFKFTSREKRIVSPYFQTY